MTFDRFLAKKFFQTFQTKIPGRHATTTTSVELGREPAGEFTCTRSAQKREQTARVSTQEIDKTRYYSTPKITNRIFQYYKNLGESIENDFIWTKSDMIGFRSTMEDADLCLSSLPTPLEGNS